MRNFGELWERILSLRIWPLIMKELRQISRNRRLMISLILPPTIQIMLFGFALNPEVTNLRLGIVDESHSSESRELVSAFVEARSFRVSGYYSSQQSLGSDISAGRLDAGIVVPADFARKRLRKQSAEVQLLLDAVDSNRAQIAGGYASFIINALNLKLLDNIRKQMAAPAQNDANESSASAIGNSDNIDNNGAPL